MNETTDLVTVYSGNESLTEFEAPTGQTALSWARRNLFDLEEATHFEILRLTGEVYKETKEDHA